MRRKLTPTEQFNYILENAVLKLRVRQTERQVLVLENQIDQLQKKKRSKR